MAVRTSIATGNWSAGGTWNTGVPADGDTAIIASGHTVTVDVDTTVGTSPADTTTYVIDCTGHLTVDTDVTLTCKGNVYVRDGSNYTQEAGSEVIFDGRSASNQRYRLFSQGAATLAFNGTSGNGCTLRGYNSSALGEVYCWLHGYDFTATYTTFKWLATGSTGGFSLIHGGPCDIDTQNCTFDTCGRITMEVTSSATSDFILRSNLFTNSTNTTATNGLQANSSPTTGTHEVVNNVWETGGYPVRFDSSPGITVTGNYFGDTVSTATTSANFAPVAVTDCYLEAPLMHQCLFSLLDCYLASRDSTDGNPHFIALKQHTTDQTVDGVVCEWLTPMAASDTGEVFALGALAGGTPSLTIKNCIILPAGEYSPGAMIHADVASTIETHILHNTAYVKDHSALQVTESVSSATGVVDSYKSNLIWCDAAGDNFKANRQANTADTDPITASGVDYNVGYNLGAGSDGRGYDNGPSSADLWTTGAAAAVGADDSTYTLDSDPQFVDATRNIATWAAYKGEASTTAAGQALLRGDTSLIADLVTWVKAGFDVQNADLEDAGHDGATIGAGSYVAASSPSTPTTEAFTPGTTQQRPSTPNTSTASGLNEAAEVSTSNGTDEFSDIKRVFASYSEAPTASGNLTVKSGSTTVLDMDITAAGYGIYDISPGQTEKGEDMTVTLTAGGAGITGKLTVIRE